tara:strand:+ start:6423 stop:7484 length:1062 start_codon:yes stop_codon:yes gene_type:complete
MALRASKPTFNVREKLTELGRRFGLKGSELVSAETVQEARDLVSAGRKNLIINGELQIWQRGTSITADYSSRPYTADMFRIYNVNSGSGATFSQSTDVPSNEFTYSLKRDTTGKNGHSEINIPIELNRTGSESPFVPGEIYTFSFWVKGDGTDTSWINIVRARWSSSLTGGTYITTKVIKEYSGSGNWEKVICQFAISPDVPATATYLSILIGRNNSHIGINYWTGFQLEKGRNATEFEHRSYGEELALCQRYFFKLSNSRLIMGYKRHDTSANFAVECPVPMRASPAPTLTAGGTFTNFQSNFNTTQSSPNVYEWNSVSGNRFLFQVASTWSSTHSFVPSWEGFTAEFSAEL